MLPVCETRDSLSESRMREICLSGSMSGKWKRSMAWLGRHRQTKGPATDRPSLSHRATSRLYVRLGKGVWCLAGESPARQGSFQPVVIGAMVEVTKPSESSVIGVGRTD